MTLDHLLSPSQHGLQGNRAISSTPWSVVRAMGRAYTLRLHRLISDAQAAAAGDDKHALTLWLRMVRHAQSSTSTCS